MSMKVSVDFYFRSNIDQDCDREMTREIEVEEPNEEECREVLDRTLDGWCGTIYKITKVD